MYVCKICNPPPQTHTQVYVQVMSSVVHLLLSFVQYVCMYGQSDVPPLQLSAILHNNLLGNEQESIKLTTFFVNLPEVISL